MAHLTFGVSIIASLLLSASFPVLAYPSFPSFTHTHGYTVGTTELCTTSYAPTSAKKAVPTYSNTITLRADVIIIITNSLPAATITPQPTTVTETSNTYAEVTTTIDTITNTFFSTSTVLWTTIDETTTTLLVTETETSLETVTETKIIPTPTGFVTIVDSAGADNYTEIPPGFQVQDNAPNLELRNTPSEANLLLRKDDGAVRDLAQYAGSVNCNQYLKPTWTEVIALIRQTVTVTAPRSTSTATVTDTITTTSTVAPSVSTTLTTTVTDFITEFSDVTTSATLTSTTSITATVSATEYDACRASNIMAPHIDYKSGAYIDNILFKTRNKIVGEVTPDAVSCCAACQTKQDCLFNVYFWKSQYCAQVLDGNGVCNPGGYGGSILWFENPAQARQDFLSSNGPCGTVRTYENPGYNNPPPDSLPPVQPLLRIAH